MHDIITKDGFHELKMWPEFFKHVWSGDKTFELRVDDRGFRQELPKR
jgi:hypothetical protein